MADPFVAEIRIFPFSLVPQGWALCNGQLMPIGQNNALFSLLGITYGGNGRTNFALPNLQDRFALAPGQGPGLSLRDLGEAGGSAAITLQPGQMPGHTHQLLATASATSASPVNTALSQAVLPPSTAVPVYRNSANRMPMAPDAVAVTGGGQPHNNRQPYLALNFCIALQGIYPTRG